MAKEQTVQGGVGSRWLTSTVVAIALASLLSDACYESIIPLLPAFIASLGGGALAVGLTEGVADGLAAVFKLWGGRLADRTKRRRAWTAAGYLGVGLFMPAIALAKAVPAVVALRSAAWTFRGFRSPLRDTLLVDGTAPAYVNRAFGFQRALDTVGAVIGPAAAMTMIAAHVPLRWAIAAGLIPGILAALMCAWVREQPRAVVKAGALHVELAALPAAFKRYLLAAGVFGAGNFSATLLVLVAIIAWTPHVGAQRAVVYGAALYLLHNALQASLSYPASIASEKIGSGRLLLAAFALFAAVCTLLAFAWQSVVAVAVAFIMAAAATAIVEPMEATFATLLLPAQRRGTGFGALAAINGLGDFASSAGVGLLWQTKGAALAFGSAAVVCAIGLLLILAAVRAAARPPP